MSISLNIYRGNVARALGMGLLCLAASLASSSSGRADTVFESATNPVIGQLGTLLLDTNGYEAARFTLTAPTTVTDVGAHLLTTNPAVSTSLFAAIVPLPCGGTGCFPVDPSLIATTALASTTFASASSTSTDHLTPLSVVLPAGDYALVLGGGLSTPIGSAVPNPFGSTGSGQINTFNTLVPGSTFFFFNPLNGDRWVDFFGTQPNLRFVVEGSVVSAPVPIGSGVTALTLAALLTFGLLAIRRRRLDSA